MLSNFFEVVASEVPLNPFHTALVAEINIAEYEDEREQSLSERYEKISFLATKLCFHHFVHKFTAYTKRYNQNTIYIHKYISCTFGIGAVI